MDIQVEAAAVDYKDLESRGTGESSADIRQRVLRAHRIQQERYKDEGILFNAQLSSAQIERYCELGDEENMMMKRLFDTLEFSARAYHKLLKLARTIADLSGDERIGVRHIIEASQLRNLDRKLLN
jgi:magnesium chelatase family protein